MDLETQTWTAPTANERNMAFRRIAGGFVTDHFADDPDGLDDGYTVARFVDAVEDLTILSDDDGVTLSGAGRYAPEGVVGNYPALWAEVTVADGAAIWKSVDALNSEHVRIHIIDMAGGQLRVCLAPAIDDPNRSD